MAFLDLFRSAGVPAEPAHAPQRRGGVISRKRAIAAGEVTRLNATWAASNIPADEEIRRSIDRIRARARDLAYNNEYARKYLQMVQTHVVGPAGFTLQALAADGRTPDRLARDAIELGWWQWGLPGVCEASGRHSFADFTRLVVEACARDGEAIVLRRRGADNAFGYQLKLIEIDRLPAEKNDTLKDGARIVMGVELNPDGAPVAYWLNLGLVGSGAPAQLTRVPAAEVLHLYRPNRPEQRRGLSWLTPVMSGLKMLAGYEEAAIVAARVGAAKMGFYTSPDGNLDALADDKIDGEFYTDAEAGAFAVLPPGYDFKSWDPDYPHQGYKDFVQARLRSIASGLGIAYHTLANDLADVNYSSARAGTLEERDNWIVLQNWLISSFLRPVFLDWIDESIKRGALTMPNGSALPAAKRDKFAAHEWQGRRWTWVDPLKDIEASRLAIKTGIASPQMIAAQNGVDIDDVLQDIKRFEERVAELKVGLIDYEITPKTPEPAAPVAPAPDPLRELAIASLARSLEPRESPPPQAPVEYHFHQGETRNEVNVPAPEVRVDVAPAAIQIDVAAPVVSIEPAAVEVRVEALMPEQPAPIVEVKIEAPDEIRIAALPTRTTTTEITRDAAGNIVASVQRETDT